MRTILLAAAIAFTTCGGAPFGAYASPFTILAFFGGLKRGSSGPTPPVAAEALSPPEDAPPVLAAIDTDGARHAKANRHALSSSVRKRGGISLSSAYGVS